ncbi:hypothetical protein L1987_73644 [Smallanthus sonchifolius]|uniref:Uncharacterized protein n=1 Tax=Smallanthus sonchifolius TaxID=185202 RepID=A0ACB9A001_9ASTR|nr:hypothetical protein L1987_73644 [Smallanthus sonchifolius]
MHSVKEKAEKATARTQEEKEIAHQRRKAKEAKGKMNLHDEKAEHVAEKMHGKHHVFGCHWTPAHIGWWWSCHVPPPITVGSGYWNHRANLSFGRTSSWT